MVASVDLERASPLQYGPTLFTVLDVHGSRTGVAPGPQAFVVSTADPDAVTRTHFHDVDQFQLFLGGNGRLGRHALRRGVLHYADANTPYGPICAGSEGFSYVTLRARADVGAHYMPESRRDRRLFGGRNIASVIDLHATGRQDVIPAQPDGLAAVALRFAADEPVALPHLSGGDGAHVVVLDGRICSARAEVVAVSDVFLEPHQSLTGHRAGAGGALVVIVSFPTPRDR